MATNLDEPTFLRPSEVARRVSRSRAWVYREIKSGELRAVKFGGWVQVPFEEYRRWVAAKTEPYTPTIKKGQHR